MPHHGGHHGGHGGGGFRGGWGFPYPIYGGYGPVVGDLVYDDACPPGLVTVRDLTGRIIRCDPQQVLALGQTSKVPFSKTPTADLVWGVGGLVEDALAPNGVKDGLIVGLGAKAFGLSTMVSAGLGLAAFLVRR